MFVEYLKENVNFPVWTVRKFRAKFEKKSRSLSLLNVKINVVKITDF